MGVLPSCAELRESGRSREQLAGVFDPVLRERGLDRVHDGPADPHGEIAHVLLVLGVAEPGVDDAVTSNQGDAAVEHHELAMVALVEHPDVRPALRMVPLEFAAGGGQLALDVGPHVLAAVRVYEHADGDAGAAAFDQGVHESPLERPRLPEEGLEVHGSRGVLDLVDHDVEERAVLEQLHAVAVVDGALGQPRQRRHQLGQRRVAIDLEHGRLVPPDRPDDGDEQADQHKEQPDDDGRNRYRRIHSLQLVSAMTCGLGPRRGAMVFSNHLSAIVVPTDKSGRLR